MKQEVLQARLQTFVENLSHEAGEPALAAVLVVHWRNDISSGVVMGVPTEMRMKVLASIGKTFVKVIESLKVRMNTRRNTEDDADELQNGKKS